MVLPEGFTLPPLPYLLLLLAAAGIVVAALQDTRPAITESVIVAFAPWMVLGAGLNVLYEVHALPAFVAPFFGPPAVYLTTFVVAGATWLLAVRAASSGTSSVPALLGGVGAGGALAAVAVALGYAAQNGTLRLLWPALGAVVATVLAAAVWVGATRLRPTVTSTTGRVGALALFGHALDGVSTAVGIDVLGFAERTPLSRAILDLAGTLPTAGVLGVGWLFVLTKVALALAVVWLFADYIRDDPSEGYLLLALVAAVGLGPGAHNLLLFAITG